jgi:putative peptidoglycan lipid II flippase
MVFRPLCDLRHADLWRYLRLTLPLMVGLTMMFSTEVFTKFFGSYLPAGSIAWLEYAMRVMLMLVAFFGQAIGVASYPFMARLAAEGRMADLNRLLNETLRYLCLVLPFAVLIIVLREEIVTLLYMRGKFTRSDVLMTAPVLAMLMLGAVAFVTQTVVNRGFYAIQNTLLPAVFGTLTVVASLPLYYLGMTWWGLKGVGLAVSLSALVQVVVLFMIWNHRSRNIGSREVYGSFLRLLLLSIPLWAVLTLFHGWLSRIFDSASLSGCVVMTAAVSAGFLLLLVALSVGFRVPEITALYGRLRNRTIRRG